MASRPWMLNSSVHAASTHASTTGRYSGLHPAMHRVDRDLLDRALDEVGRHDGDDLVGRARRALEHPQHARLGRRDDGQPVGPARGRTSPRPRPRGRRARRAATASVAAAMADGELLGHAGVERLRAAAGAVLGQAVAEATRRRTAAATPTGPTRRAARPPGRARPAAASAPSRRRARRRGRARPARPPTTTCTEPSSTGRTSVHVGQSVLTTATSPSGNVRSRPRGTPGCGG